jgi:MFS family permease
VQERSLTTQILIGFGKFVRWAGVLIRGEVVRRVGGQARARVIVIFGMVLALNGADGATIGAIAPQLEHAMHIDNTDIGLLSSVTLLIGAIATIPVGLLVDRTRRIPVLAVSIVLWSVASLLSAFAGSFGSLLVSRLILGAVVATAGPAIASLTGDYFPANERGRVYAYILGGEIAGNAFGFIVSGFLASVISWRAAFIVLAIPGFFLARELFRTVPEPLRGGQSHLQPGVEDLVEAAALARQRQRDQQRAASDPNQPPSIRLDGEVGDAPPEADNLAREAAWRMGARPDPGMVLNEDPRKMGLIESVRYVLRIPSNLVMILSSSTGYFYFSGLSTFALLFVRGHYNVGQAKSEFALAFLVGGALVGTLVSGRVTDALVRAGHLNARVWVPAGCYIVAAVLLVPGMLITHLTPALWFDTAGAALICAANPPQDAARLDIVPAGLWGRAESVRTVIRSLAQAAAPLVFGGLSDLIAGIFPAQAPIGTHAPSGSISESSTRGLEITFLILLATLAASGIWLLRARHTYPTDVATAAASHPGSSGEDEPPVPATQRRDDAHTSRSRPEPPAEQRSNRPQWE